MRRVFADTFYWVAIANPNDQWHERARQARAALGPTEIVTTEEVLVEFLAALSGKGVYFRTKGVQLTNGILENSLVTAIPQSHESFVAGLALYARRPDKEYSLTDCISMATMREEGITEILTNDHHFTQEGFIVLVRQE